MTKTDAARDETMTVADLRARVAADPNCVIPVRARLLLRAHDESEELRRTIAALRSELAKSNQVVDGATP